MSLAAADVEIATERLTLRRAAMVDATDMHRVLSDARAMRYWSGPPHESLDQTREWLAGMIAAPADESDDFVVVRDGRVIGKAGCWRLPEIGFILHPDFWGQGLAREALVGVIKHLFLAHRMDAITADVDPRNTASLGLLERLGFVETGRAEATYEIAGELVDSIYLALPRGSLRP